MTVRRAGRLVLCMGTRSTFGEYGGCSSAAERARQVFGRSPCRPVRVRPSHITRAVLASRAPLARRPSITLVRRDGSNRNTSCEVVREWENLVGLWRVGRVGQGGSSGWGVRGGRKKGRVNNKTLLGPSSPGLRGGHVGPRRAAPCPGGVARPPQARGEKGQEGALGAARAPPRVGGRRGE